MGVKSIARKKKKNEIRIELQNGEKEGKQAEKSNVVGGGNDGRDYEVSGEDTIKQVNGTGNLIDCSEDRKEKKKTKKKRKEKKEESVDDVEGKTTNYETRDWGEKKKTLIDGDGSDDVEIELKTDEGSSRKRKKKRTESKNVDEVSEEYMSQKENGVEGTIDCLEDMEENKKKRSKKKKESAGGVEGEVMSDDQRETERKKKKSIREDDSDDVRIEAKSDEGKGKKKKKKRTEREIVNEVGEEDTQKDNVDGVGGKVASEAKRDADKKKKKVIGKGGSSDVGIEAMSDEGKGKKKKKKRTDSENVCDGIEDNTMEKTKRKRKSEKNTSDDESKQDKNEKRPKKTKSVSFSDDVEIFDENSFKKKSWKVSNEDGLVQGKRFTPEEDETVRKAVFEYIEERNLGDEGLDMILNCKKHPEVKNCWKEIAEAIPQRPLASVYYRAHILFERADARKWTDEEKEYVQRFYEEHGADWKTLATQLNKHRFHCKDTWRRNKLKNRNKGRWKQEEYQGLFDLVNMDLRMRALEERKSKHGMLRDNICWEAISDKLATRNNSTCCMKWYAQLTSPMVAEGLWADTDDYRLIDALVSADAASFAEVDWDNLLEHREGVVSRKRWNQMVKYIGDYAKLSFCEQVEVLAKRYNPDCVEVREEFDSKPIVDRPS